MYSTAQKKVKVPAVWFGCGIRSRLALVRSGYAVRFGAVRYFCTRCARIRPSRVNAHAQYCMWLIFLRIFHAVNCAVGSGLPQADSVDFTMCLEGPYFIYPVSR